MEKKLQEKKFFIDNAEKIVSKLSCDTFTERETGQFLKQIEPYHYEEIVEERFVSKLCGYPCCGNELTNIPTKKYQISTKLNKVFELSDRKRYCCNECYKSSKFIEAQISSVPVWLRNTPDFLRGEGANEIKFWSSTVKPKPQAKPKLLPTPPVQNDLIKSLSVEIESELKQIEQKWESSLKLKEEPLIEPAASEEQLKEKKKSEELNEAKLDADLKERSEQLKKKFIESMEIHKKPTDFSNLKKIFLFQIQKENEILTIGEGKEVYSIIENNLPQLYFIEYIVQRIKEIINSRTKAYLLQIEPTDKPTVNEERERQEYLEACDKLVSKKTALFSDIDYGSSDSKFYPSPLESSENDNGEEEMIAKLKGFEDLFKTESSEKNDEKKEIRDEEYDSEVKKPLPDYAKLKEEAIQQQLKIKEFFTGTSMSRKKVEATVIDENESNLEYNQNLIFKIKETNEEIVRVLPTVDSKSQNEIRRKIFYDKLIRYLEQLLKFSEFNYTALSNPLKNHVKNFVYSLKLTNENIIFTSNEWPIVSLFILKILSLKKGLVNNIFDKLVREDRLIETILNSFKLDQSKLETICDYMIK